jgi:hypothetical protein
LLIVTGCRRLPGPLPGWLSPLLVLPLLLVLSLLRMWGDRVDQDDDDRAQEANRHTRQPASADGSVVGKPLNRTEI